MHVNARGWLVFALVFASLSACEDSRPSVLDQVGDPCRATHQTCFDDDSIQRCEDGVWAVADCQQVCAEVGPAYVADGCGDDCVCVLADPNGCTPGETACMGADTLGTCSPMQGWESSSCEQRCAASQLGSIGCLDPTVDSTDSAACWCTAEGTACSAAEPTCVDDSTLGRCIDGVWVFQDCSVECGGLTQCDPWGSPAACAC
jgi:hypothetical protein